MSLHQQIDLSSFKHETISCLDGAYWFHERSGSFPGQAFSLEIARILHHSKSPYQDILVFESTTFGNVLVLNGIVQCTERDEFVYQELITHVPIMSHSSPKNVLVIGGGDCGVVRELVKHIELGSVEHVTMVEIDDMVINLSVEFLPNMAKFHKHPKVNIVIDDGFKFLSRDHEQKFDVIITDSSDPDGPAEEFFQVNYFELLRNSLTPDGIVIMQSSENIWLNIDYLKQLIDKCKVVFANVDYCQCYMPSYTSGQLGLLIATNDAGKNLRKPLRALTTAQEQQLFKYYNSRMHESAFVLPTWAHSKLDI